MKKQNDQSFCGGPIFNITTNLLSDPIVFKCSGLIFNITTNLLSDPIVFKKFNLMQIADTFLDTGGEIYPHRQVCTELSYIISGKGTFVSDEKKFEVSEGDVHIIPSGSMHAITADRKSPLRYMCIGFEITSCNRNLRNFYLDPKPYMVKDPGFVRSALELLCSEIGAGDVFYEEIYEACIMQILIYAYRSANGCRKGQVPLFPKRKDVFLQDAFFVAVKYIDMHIRTISKVSELSEALNYSPEYLSRIFSEKTGDTLQNYIKRKKVIRSTELLKSSKMSVEDIAEYLGMSSYRSFSRIFKRFTGITPTQYRQKQREE